MVENVVTELVLGPAAEDVRHGLDEAPGWGSYSAQLRSALESVLTACDADTVEVDALVANRPLPDDYADLRNGMRLSPVQSVDLAVEMAAGHGPYCGLVITDRIRLESGWDGFVHLYMAPEVAEQIDCAGGSELSVDWRTTTSEIHDGDPLVHRIADDEFWAAVRDEAAVKLTLLCERRAYGAYGCRWFCVTPANLAQIAGAVRSRSLLGVAAGPVLRLDSALLDDAFTAFEAPIAPGELAHRGYLYGADTLAEVTDDGFTLMLDDAAVKKWCAVVPDDDGVNRGRWAAD